MKMVKQDVYVLDTSLYLMQNKIQTTEGKVSSLKSAMDILTSEQYMDLDHAEVMDMWGTDCQFECISARP